MEMMSAFLFVSIASALISAGEGYRIELTDIHPHRGGGKNPENTLYGFERNLRDGVSLDMGYPSKRYERNLR